MKKILFSLLVGAAVIASAQTQFQQESVGFLTFTKGKISQLAEAMPDDKYSWSPSEGVRNFGSVIGHAISANYFLGSKMGVAIPEGVNPMTIEKELTTKKELMEALDKSHEFVVAAINGIKESEMGDKVELPFPGEYTKMSLVNIVVNHSSEHLGQMIAYARSNNVAPPWSGGE